MTGATFKTNPIQLKELLQRCGDGRLQLPEFQRSWVWDDDRIRSLIASISRAFPVGAFMTLTTGGNIQLKTRPIEGISSDTTPEALLLDGQQRMTSLYQATMLGKVVETVTANNKKVKRWYYIDMQRALADGTVRDEAIIGVPEDRVIRRNFAREVVLDLSSPEREFAEMMFPLGKVFNEAGWRRDFGKYWREQGSVDKEGFYDRFEELVVDVSKNYQVPVIALEKETSKEAVCLVLRR